MIKFDCYLKEHKLPQGALRSGSSAFFRVKTARGLEIDHINIIVRKDSAAHTFVLSRRAGSDAAQMQDGVGAALDSSDYDVFEGNITLHGCGFHRYRFELVKQNGIMYFAGTRDGHSAVVGDWLPEWQIFVYDSDFETPSDSDGAVMYQIFPDRFFKSPGFTPKRAKNERIMHQSWQEKPYCCYDYAGYKCNDYFGGNLRGIEQKLPYIKSLGVTHIYLNPIFESAENHRYSTSDYMSVDPYLGDSADFISLCRKAAEYDIKIILDGVFSHTGDDSIYFNKYGHYPSNGAYNSKQSPYYGWYSFTDYPDSYDCWWGFKTLPNVKETESSYAEFITGENGVLRHWMRLGASGWRLDVADELPDEFLDKVRCAVKAENPQAPVIGEVWENAVKKCSYGARRRFLSGAQCDSVMNYPFANAVCLFMKNGDAQAFYESVMEIVNDYPAPAVKYLMNMLSTHDTARIINRLALDSLPPRQEQSGARLTDTQRQRGIELFKSAAILQYTLPGIPCIFYGDEAGLDGFEDPFCRGTYPWGREEKSLLNLHEKLGIIRRENRKDFSQDIEFIKHDSGVVHYRRGGLGIIVNMSHDSIYSDGFENTLAANRLENGALKHGGAVIFRAADFKE